MDRRAVDVSVCDVEQYDAGWIPYNLAEAITWLQRHLVAIPEEYRASATIDINSTGYYDSQYAQIKIGYVRPENNEEVAGRVAAAQWAIKIAEDREREQFERLRAKFEGKS